MTRPGKVDFGLYGSTVGVLRLDHDSHVADRGFHMQDAVRPHSPAGKWE